MAVASQLVQREAGSYDPDRLAAQVQRIRPRLASRNHPPYAERIASAGGAQRLVEVRVADAEGRGLASSETTVLGFWHRVALQDAPLHIWSSVIMAGLMKTPVVVEPLKGVSGAGSVEKMMDVRGAQCPTAHMSDAGNVAEAAAYRRSNAAKYVTVDRDRCRRGSTGKCV